MGRCTVRFGSRPHEARAGRFTSRGLLGKGEVSLNILRLIVSIVIPPLGVFWQVGFTGQFWLNVILTLIGYIPGLVHAAFIIFTRD
jgi:uncharacterized membrane protein YqaE (UPF0057 family)